MSPTGHLAIGFAVKRWDSKIPLVWFLVGAYAIDLIYVVLLALGIESFGNDPWSHSLLMAIVYSMLIGMIAWLFTKQRRSAILMGVVVFSHWILDFIVWGNLPLAFDKTPLLGLGLYNVIGFDISVPQLNMGMMIAGGLELIMLIIGFILYRSSLKKSTSSKRITQRSKLRESRT